VWRRLQTRWKPGCLVKSLKRIRFNKPAKKPWDDCILSFPSTSRQNHISNNLFLTDFHRWVTLSLTYIPTVCTETPYYTVWIRLQPWRIDADRTGCSPIDRLKSRVGRQISPSTGLKPGVKRVGNVVTLAYPANPVYKSEIFPKLSRCCEIARLPSRFVSATILARFASNHKD